MATLFKNILPIPESVVAGNGSYTVPANKYGFLSACTTSTISAGISGPSGGVTGTASAVAVSQWVTGGTSISASWSTGTISGSNTPQSRKTSLATAIVNLNGKAICLSYTRADLSISDSTAGWAITGSPGVGWSVSLFPIPLNNLPESLST